ncbi:hypothetical protein HDU96_004594, partial [Phlyctochytrium bullatum]
MTDYTNTTLNNSKGGSYHYGRNNGSLTNLEMGPINTSAPVIATSQQQSYHSTSNNGSGIPTSPASPTGPKDSLNTSVAELAAESKAKNQEKRGIFAIHLPIAVLVTFLVLITIGGVAGP